MKKIPLRLSGGEGVDYEDWPVTQGIPFADGEIENGTPARVVDDRGQPLPTQTRTLATWNKDLKYVRWLLVDFQANLAAGGRDRYFLEYGPDAQSPTPPHPVEVTEAGGYWSAAEGYTVSVDTGALQLELHTEPGYRQRAGATNFFRTCRVKGPQGWQDCWAEGKGPFLYMRDGRGNAYDTCTAAPRPAITVEEAGPLRTSLCVKGYHAAQEGQRFCPYILRIHLFAGKRDIRVHHTFIFNQEPHFVELAAIGVKLPAAPEAPAGAWIGGESRAHGGPGSGKISYVQKSDIAYEAFRDGKRVGGGARAGGWILVSGAGGSIAAAVRDAWQEYPKGLAAGPGGLDVQVWPEACGETLTFTTPFEEEAIQFGGTRDEEEVKRLLAERPTAPLNLKSLRVGTEEDLRWVEGMLEKYAPDRAASHNDTGTENGLGAAKTTEFLVRFCADEMSTKQADALAAAVREPLIAPADPAHTCATGAVGQMYHAGDPRFTAVDEGLDWILDAVAAQPRRIGRLYGMMRYGNMVCSHATGPMVAYLAHKDEDPEKAFRYIGPYNNEANDQIMGVWGNFVRTGRRDHFLLARAYSRAVGDCSTIHASPDNPVRTGLMHYHNCHVWSGGPSPSHTLVSGTLTDYYFTGDRRMLEVAREAADWAVRNQEPSGIVSCRDYALHREFTGPLWTLLEVYQATWEERYGELARRSLNWLLRTLPRPADYPVSVYTRGPRGDEAVIEPPSGPFGHARDLYYLFMIATRIFDSPTLREHILAEADAVAADSTIGNYVTAETARRYLEPNSRLWPVDDKFYWTDWTPWDNLSTSVCVAYHLAGNMTYAAVAKYVLEHVVTGLIDRCRHFADIRFTWICLGSLVPRLMRVVADAAHSDPAGLAQAERAWKQSRAEAGIDLYEGPGLDLSKHQMNESAIITDMPPVDLPREKPPRPREPVTDLGPLSTENHPGRHT